ncbi:MAG TPA: phytanoyl-CoA dioxygenase family protein [Stellaceae bacterium]|nr:phytanoyl-CoA dioxygenase family protein [Stellaceae bacterium]
MPSAADTLRQQGWVLAEAVLGDTQRERLAADLEAACAVCRRWQSERGLADGRGSAHHLLPLGASFLDFLRDLPLRRVIAGHFGGPFILNSFGGVDNDGAARSYLHRPHRDVRHFTAELPLMLNVLVMLDAFSAENGATLVLPGSHRRETMPDAATFFARARPITGPAGSVLLFDSNLVHAAGENRSGARRRALTLTFTPPFIKPQIDHVRQLGDAAVSGLDDATKQVLGYFSRIPANHDEWYRPKDERFYREDAPAPERAP